LHPNPYSSKFPAVPSQLDEESRGTLPHDGCDRTGIGSKLELRTARVRDAEAVGERAGQVTAHQCGDRLFVAAAGVPGGESGVGGENAVQGLG